MKMVKEETVSVVKEEVVEEEVILEIQSVKDQVKATISTIMGQ